MVMTEAFFPAQCFLCLLPAVATALKYRTNQIIPILFIDCRLPALVIPAKGSVEKVEIASSLRSSQ